MRCCSFPVTTITLPKLRSGSKNIIMITFFSINMFAEGKSMATSYDCKFIETSVGINHNVDELLVGLLKQIRLKLENPERNRDLFRKRSRKNRSKSPLGSCSENNSPKKYRGSRTSASLKVRHLLDKVWARDSKSKSCENLHVL